jgi:catalase (peroxidase I)|eukprot:COSAG06_NODE_16466_length_999_cov_9.585610_2_plen_65_part_00
MVYPYQASSIATTEPIGYCLAAQSVLEDYIDVMGLTKREFVALLGGGHSLGQMHPERSGFTGQW